MMDYNSTFLGLIVAGVVLVAVGFGLIFWAPAMRPGGAYVAERAAASERSPDAFTGSIGAARAAVRPAPPAQSVSR